MGITSLFSKPKQPNIAAAQEAAARKERDKLAQEQATKENKALSMQQAELSKRQSFVHGITNPDEEQRKRFLKSAY